MTNEIALPRIHSLTGIYDNALSDILNNQNLLHDVLLLHIVPIGAKCAAVTCVYGCYNTIHATMSMTSKN